ncbi:hypothetical protein LTR16_012578, partial [Cryomyces antarcticus]
DEGKFDPSSIPKKKWEEYQAELWDAQTQRDDRSEISGVSYATKSFHPHASEYGYGYNGYGYAQQQQPTLRPMSQVDAPRYGSRLSLAPSEIANRGYNEMELSDLAGVPSDDAILAEIREILRTADLMT